MSPIWWKERLSRFGADRCNRRKDKLYMRYSMLVYISKMGKTLLEAAEYLRAAPADALRTDIVENGRQMLAQIREVLEQYRDDLRSETPLKQLAKIENAWGKEDRNLGAQLRQLIQQLPRQVSYQVRAVFFAELGEKWDAMESVYEYMRDDLRFDPVIVRTPVGRVVERDGKREQEILYKDFLTPMGIPSLGYDQYDIAEDCPELAFISQPYESCTLEQFWPETIAKYSRLVYLPYFLPDKVEDGTVISLAQMPVYRFAWKVICPTEKQYKFYRRHSANQGANALLTGAPKTDPFVALYGKTLPLPSSWRCIEGKTVFLWNSWYDMNASSLRYFEALLEWFDAHQEDCALIWRPHPMTDAVTKLHYPDQYPSYQAMIKRVCDTRNAVLDLETSCATAFSISNAIISDYSSLLAQYLLLDKPALWMKGKNFHFTGEEFIEGKWMEQAENIDHILAFMDRCRNGEDRNAAFRSVIRRRDLYLADGHCGERICSVLWDSLRQEDDIL